MIVASKLTDWWVYLIAPIVGGACVATMYLGALIGHATVKCQLRISESEIQDRQVLRSR